MNMLPREQPLLFFELVVALTTAASVPMSLGACTLCYAAYRPLAFGPVTGMGMRAKALPSVGKIDPGRSEL